MSIRKRLEDAQFLFANERFDGALLSVLVGIAATSRKRRPVPTKDRVAFESFLGEEMIVVTGGGVANYNVMFREEMMPLQKLLYKFVRNELAHEGKLPKDVKFVDGEPGRVSLEVQPEAITLSKSWMEGLMKCVQFAPENGDEFPEFAETPDDVLRWLMFGKRRDSDQAQAYWRKRAEFAG